MYGKPRRLLQDSYVIVYLIDGKSANPLMAEEILAAHLRGIPKASRIKTREPKPGIAYTSNGTFITYPDGRRFRKYMLMDGREEPVDVAYNGDGAYIEEIVDAV